MARRRFKMTAAARFIILLLIGGPLAYIVASYVNGEDGLENIRSFFSQDPKVEQTITPSAEDQSEFADVEEGTQNKENSSPHYLSVQERLSIQQQQIDSLFQLQVRLQAQLDSFENVILPALTSPGTPSADTNSLAE